MSRVHSQPLDGGSPRRLLREAGKWVLEVVRHVNLGQGLIRPTTQRLSGNRAITSYFASNPDKALLGKATQKLIQVDTGHDPRTYNAVGAEWIMNSMPPGRGDGLDSYPAPGPSPTLETELGQVKAQVLALTLVQEGLLTRLARLEAKLARGSWAAEQGPSSSAGELRERSEENFEREDPPASESPPPSFVADGGLGAADEGTESEQGVEPLGDDAGLERAVATTAESPAIAKAPVAERLELTLPSVAELAKCIALLVGGDVSAQEGPPLAVNRTTRDCYGALLLDDTDRTVGLILMDLKATVYLGGTLMMLPKAELEQQLNAQSPGEDSIAASAEICNALSGAVNGAQGQHVRVGGLERFEFKTCSWVTEPAHRRDLVDNFGGRTVVFSRPVPTQIF